MKNFDPEFYSISVRKEEMDGELLYVARIKELPDVMEFADSFEEARELALDTIQTSYEMCLEQNIPFPKPVIENEIQASGRITLRLPKSLHAKLIVLAEEEEVSLNQYLVSALSVNYGQCDMLYKVTEKISQGIAHIRSSVGELNRDMRVFTKASHAMQSDFSAISSEDLIIIGEQPTDIIRNRWTLDKSELTRV
ncbi:toxin-antitoxin system HicB family antitoxin [Vibrio parahaemolyticus]|uniref:toxin-antitoxin system HicB family antitoxin n=1 Tax=Vibrio parahaemolyticus TaxID=670 RepID=UPI00045F3523|nr:toxin-antitoxin system HicB family antitoxin [Vibrio parahaemolyticus]GAK17376.1 hypothetical protein JCM19053_2554 [Vibrio sp. JCM 19053]